jgi:uncharacterized protein YgiM (DUF1202 family)
MDAPENHPTRSVLIPPALGLAPKAQIVYRQKQKTSSMQWSLFVLHKFGLRRFFNYVEAHDNVHLKRL